MDLKHRLISFCCSPRRVLASAGFALAVASTMAGAADYPRVGLVLGGGGARGAAHIGILEVLKEHNVPIACVSGTSMGGLVSGAFAAGLTPEEMLTALDAANWRDMFIDKPEASQISARNKTVARVYLPGSEAGLTEDGLRGIPGIVDGQKIKLFFNRLVGSQYGERTIESLGIPTAIIATDLLSGEKVVFREGSLTTAMRASMSVPGVLTPVRYGERVLVDGGLVDNVPIDVVRSLCEVDVVIAVNVGSPMLEAKDIGGIFSISAQMVNLLTEQNVARSLEGLMPQDIYIRPELGDLSAGDFDRYREAAQMGRTAAEAVLPRIKALGVAQARYDGWWQTVASARSERLVVDEIEIAGLRHVNPDVVRKRLGEHSGQEVETARLDLELTRLYGDGDYQNVDYSLITARDRNILRVAPMEKAWGPDYLRFGLDLDSTLGDTADFNVRVAYHRTWLNPLGGQWLSGLQIGDEPTVFTEFYQPLDVAQRYFVQPRIGFRRETINLYQNNDRLAQYKLDEWRLELMAGVNIGVWGPIRLGWLERDRSASLDIGSRTWPEADSSFGGWYATLNFDQFDSLFVPSRGWSLQSTYFEVSNGDYARAEIDARVAREFGDYVVHGRVRAGGSPHGELPIYDALALGGFLNMSGFSTNQIVGDSVRYASVRGEKIVGRLPLGLRGDMRVGIGLEAGKVDGRYSETELEGWQGSVALYVGGETPIGPTYLGYGYSPEGISNVFLSIGKR